MSEQSKLIKRAKKIIKAPPVWLNWVLFISLITIPIIIRYLYNMPLTPLDNSYYYLIKNPDSLYDLLLRNVSFTPIVPWLLGIGSYTFFYLLIKDADKILKAYTLFFFSITPLITTIFTTFQPYSLFLLVTLIAAYTYRKHWSSGLIIALLPAILPFEGCLIALLFIIHGLIKKHELSSATTLIAAPLLIYGEVLLGWSFRLPEISLNIAWFFGEFGGLFGFSLFIILLAWYYIFNDWKTIKKEEVILFAIFFVLSRWLPGLRPIVLMPLSVYAAKGFKEIFETKWVITFLKSTTIVLLICLALFIVIEHQQLIIKSYPTQELDQIINKITREGNIITSPDYAKYIEYKTKRLVVSDILYENIATKAFEKIEQENSPIILITPEMKEGSVWQRNDEGLLFVLNNERFIRTYETQGYELWLYLKV